GEFGRGLVEPVAQTDEEQTVGLVREAAGEGLDVAGDVTVFAQEFAQGRRDGVAAVGDGQRAGERVDAAPEFFHREATVQREHVGGDAGGDVGVDRKSVV